MDLHIAFAAALGLLGLGAGRALAAAAAYAAGEHAFIKFYQSCTHCGDKHRTIAMLPLAFAGCRSCGRRTQWSVLFSEIAAAIGFAWTGFHFGPDHWEWTAGLLLVSVLIVITITDLSTMKIPNKAVAAGVAAAVAVRLFVHPLPLWNYAAAAVLGFGILYAVALLSRGGMGGGDVKLYFFIGWVCGISATFLSLLAASALGAIFGIAARLSGRLGKDRPIPFGPFIAAGSLIAYFWPTPVLL